MLLQLVVQIRKIQCAMLFGGKPSALLPGEVSPEQVLGDK